MFGFARSHFSANPKRNNIPQVQSVPISLLTVGGRASYIPCPIPLSFPSIGDGARFDNHRRANEFVREIHTRMLVILPEEHHDSWFSGEAGKEVLEPFPAGTE
jgi:hypothetical protein